LWCGCFPIRCGSRSAPPNGWNIRTKSWTCSGPRGSEPVHILGISCYYHDAAAVLLRDGQLIAASEEERFSRIKHDYGFPKMAIQYCLEAGGITGADLDYVVFFEKPFRKLDRILASVLGTYPKSWKVFRESMITWVLDKLWVSSTIQSE